MVCPCRGVFCRCVSVWWCVLVEVCPVDVCPVDVCPCRDVSCRGVSYRGVSL